MWATTEHREVRCDRKSGLIKRPGIQVFPKLLPGEVPCRLKLRGPWEPVFVWTSWFGFLVQPVLDHLSVPAVMTRQGSSRPLPSASFTFPFPLIFFPFISYSHLSCPHTAPLLYPKIEEWKEAVATHPWFGQPAIWA